MKTRRKKEMTMTLMKKMREIKALLQPPINLLSLDCINRILLPFQLLKRSRRSGVVNPNLSTYSSSRIRSVQLVNKQNCASRSCRMLKTKRRWSLDVMSTAIMHYMHALNFTLKNSKSLLKKKGKSNLSSNNWESKKRETFFNLLQQLPQVTWEPQAPF